MLAAALSVIIAVSLSACTSGGAAETVTAAAKAEEVETETTKDGESGVESMEGAKEAPVGASDKKHTIILKTQAMDFWVKMQEDVEAETMTKNMKVDLYPARSKDNSGRQLAILGSRVQQEYDGIAIAPLSSASVLPGIGGATGKGVIVVNVSEKFDETELANQGGACTAFVAADDVAAGARDVQCIVNTVGEGAKAAIMEGKSGNQSSEDGTQGAKQAFTGGKIDIINSQTADWDHQKAVNITSTPIQQNPGLEGVYCCNDSMALGTVQAAINANGLGEITVMGADGDTRMVSSTASNEPSTTVIQDPAQTGATSLDFLTDAVVSGTRGEVNKFPEKTPVESVLVTADNVADFQ